MFRLFYIFFIIYCLFSLLFSVVNLSNKKRQVDDVIVMVALRARILAGLNAVETATIGRVDPEQQWKNDFP